MLIIQINHTESREFNKEKKYWYINHILYLSIRKRDWNSNNISHEFILRELNIS